MSNCWACSKHSVTIQITAEFASNSTANIKPSKRPSFLSLDFRQVLYEV